MPCPSVSAGNTGEEARQRQGQAKATPGAQPRRAGERRTGSQGKGWMDGMEWMRLTWKRVGSIKVCRNFTTRVSYLTLALTHAHTHTPHTTALTTCEGVQAQQGQEGQGPIRLAREGATGSSGKSWVGLGWRREIISEPCSRYPKTKHTLGEKATVVMYQSQVPMRQAPCTCRGPATSARYPVGPVSVHPAVPPTWQYGVRLSCHAHGGGASSEHGGDPLSPGAVLRCRPAHRSQLGTSPP